MIYKMNQSVLIHLLKICTVLFIGIRFNDVESVRIAQDKIYNDIQNRYFCFRRLNATHQVGCQSDTNGNVGIIHVVNNSTDLEWILAKGTTTPFIPAVYLKDFTTKNLRSFRDSKRVTGVVLLHNKNYTIPENFSPDKQCPNEGFGLYNETSSGSCNKFKWNTENPATNMLFEDWSFPIFLVSEDKSIDEIVACYEKFNRPKSGEARSYPLCAVELFIQMHAAVNTPKCMSRNDLGISLEGPRRFCDPLISSNIFTTFDSFNSSSMEYDNRSIIVVTSRLDSLSMFDELVPGVDSAITSMVTLLSVANTLSNIKKDNLIRKSENSNILFALFDGEAFDYIGSSRVAYDMQTQKSFPGLKSNFQPPPINLTQISYLIDLNQIGGHAQDYKLFGHGDKSRVKLDVEVKLTKLFSELKKYAIAESLTFIETSYNQPLTPSSAQSFLKKDDEIAGIVISNHEKEYTNKYNNSYLDTPEKLIGNLTDQISNASLLVARTLLSLHTENSAITPTVDKDLVKEMLECFLYNYTCDLLQMLGDLAMPILKPSSENVTFSLYVSCTGNSARQRFINYVKSLLAFITGDEIANIDNKNSCLDLSYHDLSNEYFWMRGRNNSGVCIKSPTFTTTAQSPAFDDNNWSSTEYSTWTESVWSRPRARIFLKPSSSKEWVTFSVGLLILLFSFILVVLVDRNASIIFTSAKGSQNGNQLLTANSAVGC